jgi:GT2 family glycosyltransferase/SAM-dependent methyltransferase
MFRQKEPRFGGSRRLHRPELANDREGYPRAVSQAASPRVSVIITCYNQARFLSDAIESVLRQTYSHREIIVVDDGSTDTTSEIVASYAGLRYIRQSNQGLSAARNAGFCESKADYLVFLDADDRLLPNALEIGVGHLEDHGECALVSGDHMLITADGAPIPRRRSPCVEQDHYLALLRRNYIGMHATVMYRRAVFEAVGGFDPSLRACEDYDLYLRIARNLPIHCHNKQVAEYRQHDANMSGDRRLMLKYAVRVLRSQWKYAKGHKQREEAYKTGIQFWQTLFGDRLVTEVPDRLVQGEWRHSINGKLMLLRYHPRGFAAFASQIFSRLVSRILRAIPRPVRTFIQSRLACSILGRLQDWHPRHTKRPPIGRVRFGSLRRVTPISREFGFDRGLPIDRYYIEQFLSVHAVDIRNRVLEIGDDTYMRRFGGSRITKSDVLHVSEGNPQATLVGDLTCAGHIPSDSFDCIILTQTLHLIYDTRAALRTLYRILKPGGVLLATFPGISQLSQDRWRETWYWGFTRLSARRLFEEIFPATHVSVDVSGNVLAASAFLYGLAAGELRHQELDYRDPDYEISIMVRAVKPEITS